MPVIRGGVLTLFEKHFSGTTLKLSISSNKSEAEGALGKAKGIPVPNHPIVTSNDGQRPRKLYIRKRINYRPFWSKFNSLNALK